MNLEKLLSSYHILLEQMARDGYSDGYIKAIEWEIKWIKQHPELQECKDYLELYEKRVSAGRAPISSRGRIYHKHSMFTVLQHFEEDGEFPNHHEKIPLVKKSAYYKLNVDYRAIIDRYKEFAKAQNLSDYTIKKCISKTSCFLLFFQNRGSESIKTVTEADVISFFTDDDGNLVKSFSYKRDIESVLESVAEDLSPDIKRVCNLLPSIKRRRKNIQYFTSDESKCIQKVLANEDGILSKRDVAIGMLLYYTGMRAGDIADLRLDEIKWDSERIVRNQSKTGYPVELPLDISVGNALFAYLAEERPYSTDIHVFLWAKPPYLPIKSTVIWPVTAKIYQAAGIRQNYGDRRGSHLFRHHLATYLAEKGISQPVISDILGHESPSSLDHYLSANIEHLRECALDISAFPIAKGVFRT